MAMNHFIVFNNDKRLTLRLEDMTAQKIARMFSVARDSLYLVNDNNIVVFPEDDGIFRLNVLDYGAHYEVKGSVISSGPQLTSYTVASASVPVLTPLSAFSFGSNHSNVTPSHMSFRRNKSTISRNIQIMDVINGNMVPQQVTYLRLAEADCNVEAVGLKLQEQLNSEESYVICDSKGNEVVDCPATQGPEFWKQQSRKISAISESAFREFMSSKRKRTKRGSVSQRNQDFEDLAAEALDTVKTTLQHIAQVATTTRVLVMSEEQSAVLFEGFTCLICKGILKEPFLATCCKSLIGCKECINNSLAPNTSSNCYKCRAPHMRDNLIDVKGIDAALEYLRTAACNSE